MNNEPIIIAKERQNNEVKFDKQTERTINAVKILVSQGKIDFAKFISDSNPGLGHYLRTTGRELLADLLEGNDETSTRKNLSIRER